MSCKNKLYYRKSKQSVFLCSYIRRPLNNGKNIAKNVEKCYNKGSMMKKFIILFSIIIIIVSVVTINYMSYTKEQDNAKKYNLEYEKYYEQKIYGTHLTTIINKVINSNEKNNVEKDKNNKYIDNETNSINIDIMMTDTNETYAMEILYNGGIERFVQNYGNIQFECTKIQYHKETGKVSYLHFEQVSE